MRRDPSRSTSPGEAVKHSLKKTVQQAYTDVGFPDTARHSSGSREALDLLAVLLGDGRNAASRPYAAARRRSWSWSRRGLQHYRRERPGVFAHFAECDAKIVPRSGQPVHVGAAGPQIEHPPTTEEIRRAKNLIQTSWLAGLPDLSQSRRPGSAPYALENHFPERLQEYLPKILSLHPP